jgi:hypothetical protein
LLKIVLAAVIAASSHGNAELLKPMQHMQRVMHARVARRPPAPGWFRQVQRGFLNPPHKSAWQCIHRYEASWSDTGDPYWGGLQMDWDFMRKYGSYLLRLKGPASNWSPVEQMWVAEEALRRGRGFYPWPNTARFCGLI